MQIIGTVFILAALVTSFFYYSKKNQTDNLQKKQLAVNLGLQLEELAKEEVNLKVIYASGDNNSEVLVADAIKKIFLPEDIRIKI